MIGRYLREISRYSQVVSVLARYGFADLLSSLGLRPRFTRWGKRRAKKAAAHLSRERRIRLAFEELGPAFIKLGQLISTRPDLMTPALEEELSHLQDDVPAMAARDVIQVLSEEFPEAPGSHGPFKSFCEEPIAAASMAQVHRAELADGTSVAVKIQRAGIARIIETDISILRRLAGLLARLLSDAALYDPLGIVDEFARHMRHELDFAREARQCEQFGRILKDDARLAVPKVHWEYTTGRILTLDFIDGKKISRIAEHGEGPYDRKALARAGADCILTTVFEHGVFHGDPHPGNVLVTKDGIIHLIDFGIVGYIEDETRDHILDLTIAVVRRDVTLAVRAIVELGDLTGATDLRALRVDVRDFLETYHALPLRLLNVGEILRDLLRMISQHRIGIPAELALLSKVLIGLDGLGRRLDPDFNMVGHLEPFIKARVRERYDPRRILTDLADTARDATRLIRSLPSDLTETLRMVRENRVEFGVQHREADPVTGALREALGRLGAAIFATGLVVGSAMLVAAETPPLVKGLSIPGVAGLVAGLVLAFLWGKGGRRTEER